MLKQRLLIASVSIPLVIAAVFFLSTPVFSLLTGLLILFAAWEYAQFMGWRTIVQRSLYVGITAVLLLGAYYTSVPAEWMIMTGVVWWIIVGLGLLYCGIRKISSFMSLPNWIIGVAGILTLIPGWVALQLLHGMPYGAQLLIAMFIMIWSIDLGQFFAGRKGGFIAILLLMGLYCGWFSISNWFDLAAFFTLGLIVWVDCVIGDISERFLERRQSYTPSILLDRIDTVLAVAPVFALILLWLSHSL